MLSCPSTARTRYAIAPVNCPGSFAPHESVTVADFDQFVQFYAKNFGCRLVGVGDSDPELVLPEFQFKQADAEFYGAELSGTVQLYHAGAHDLDLNLMGDVVRAVHGGDSRERRARQ